MYAIIKNKVGDFLNEIIGKLSELSPIYKYFINIVDIVIVAIIFYAIIKILGTNTKTNRIFKGVIIVIIVDFIAKSLDLTTLGGITQNLINWGFLVFIIIFQPEIRSFLERIGRSSLKKYSLNSMSVSEDMVDEITSAVIALSRDKVGAIMSIERHTSLADFIKTGVALDADISKQLIITIFTNNSPLHDGAIIIQNNRIACASTYFPPPSVDVIQSFGSRHRAAIGISEISDCLTIVVSEETGAIRLVEFGEAYLVKPEDFRSEFLEHLTLDNREESVGENIA